MAKGQSICVASRRNHLAYWDSCSGLVPVRVLAIVGDGNANVNRLSLDDAKVLFEITANSGPYRRGEILSSKPLHVSLSARTTGACCWGLVMSKPRETYDRLVTDFVDQLERGTAPWVRPWTDGTHDLTLPYNAASNRPYHGVNVLLLWSAAQAFSYPSNGWLTFNQAKELGGHVRKGERGQLVVFFKSLVRRETAHDGEEVERTIMMLRGFTVFNVAQCEGLPNRLISKSAEQPAAVCEDDADGFILATGANIRRGGSRAFYSPSGDFIQLPERRQFESRQHDQATALHELGHWSGAEHRLNRTFGKRFGDHRYAVEELVAELVAAFLCADLGITGRLQHAEYLASWAAALRAKPTILWTASSKASEAAEYLKAAAGRSEDADGQMLLAA